MQQPIRVAFRLAAGLFLFAATARAADPIEVRVRPVGPSAEEMARLSDGVLQLPEVVRVVGKDRVRLLSVQPLADSRRYQAVLFDYTGNQAYTVEGSIAAPDKGGIVRAVAGQPIASKDEFEEAVAFLRNGSPWAKALRSGLLTPFTPMPPVLDSVEDANRTVNVGLQAKDGTTPTQIVGVDLVKMATVTYRGGVPDNSRGAASPNACGPGGGGGSNGRGLAGSAAVTITRAATTLWEFTVTRPSSSSGTSGSGIDFQNIKYKGKLLLTRAHTPILNVKYVNDACGPYRDWQYAENDFTAPGCSGNSTGVCAATGMPSTVLEGSPDNGSPSPFRGVAYYNDGVSAVTFETELTAGWYRYVMKWTFKDDGTIQSRVGFAAVSNSCVCNIHLHNAFIRLDFDVDGASNTVVSQHNQGGWQPLSTETWGRRDRLGATAFRVSNPATGDTYQITPSAFDFNADVFGVGDFWILRSKGTSEIDDGVSCVSCSSAPVQITSFVNGESVQNTKVVLYYGGHFLHNINDGDSSSEIIGPDITPVSW